MFPGYPTTKVDNNAHHQFKPSFLPNPLIGFWDIWENVLTSCSVNRTIKIFLDPHTVQDLPQNLINSSLVQGIPLKRFHQNPLMSLWNILYLDQQTNVTSAGNKLYRTQCVSEFCSFLRVDESLGGFMCHNLHRSRSAYVLPYVCYVPSTSISPCQTLPASCRRNDEI